MDSSPEERQQQRQPQLEGVVIIQLPPPDNPSQGKTICAAFTVPATVSASASASASAQQQPPPLNHRRQPLALRVRNQVPVASFIRSFLGSQRNFALTLRKVSAIAMAVVIVLAVFNMVPYNETLRGPQENQEETKNLWVLPLYSKYRANASDPAGPSPPIRLKLFMDRDIWRSNAVLAAKEPNASVGFSMKGNVYPSGLYYVSVLVGKRPRPYYLDVDTGSDLTWLQCDAPCRNCAKGPHPWYKPRSNKLVSCMDPLCKDIQASQNDVYDCSSTSMQCDYEIVYADNAFSMGVLVQDTVSAVMTNGSLVQTNFVFGCSYDQRGPLAVSPAMTDGMLGLSSAPISLPSQLAKKGMIKNVIGHCISRGSSGGYMFLGDDLKPKGGMTWVQMQGRPHMKLYSVGTPTLKCGNRPLIGNGANRSLGSVFFDSGSSFTYLSRKAYSAFISAVKESIFEKGFMEDPSDSTLPVCWTLNYTIRSVADVMHHFSPLILDFGSSPWLIKSRQFRIHPEDYLIISPQGNVCLGILDGSRVHDGNINILGDNSLQGYLVIYDNVNEMVGWVPADCQKKPNNFKSLPVF